MSIRMSDDERLRARKPLAPPQPGYLPTAGSPLTVDQELYKAIQQGRRELVESFTLPIRSGRAWKAPAKSIVRISTPEGPQVGKCVDAPWTEHDTNVDRGLEHLERGQSTGEILGFSNEAIALFPRYNI